MAEHDDRVEALRKSLEFVIAERDALRRALAAQGGDIRTTSVRVFGGLIKHRPHLEQATLVGEATLAGSALADLAAAHALLERIEKRAAEALRGELSADYAGGPTGLLPALEEIAEMAREGRT